MSLRFLRVLAILGTSLIYHPAYCFNKADELSNECHQMADTLDKVFKKEKPGWCNDCLGMAVFHLHYAGSEIITGNFTPAEWGLYEFISHDSPCILEECDALKYVTEYQSRAKEIKAEIWNLPKLQK